MLCCCLRIVHELANSGVLWRRLRHPVIKKHIRDTLLPTDDAPNKQDPLVAVGDETENDSKRFQQDNGKIYNDAANVSVQNEEGEGNVEEEVLDMLLPIPDDNLDINH